MGEFMFQSKQNTRIKYMFLICILIFIFVIVKVFYIQVIEYKKLNNLANELWSRDLTVQADRGKILDRNGKIIVDNVTTVGLYLVPNQIINKEEVSKTLSSILEVSYEENGATKTYKIQRGTKIMKALAKLAKIWHIDVNFEDFRIKHSGKS